MGGMKLSFLFLMFLLVVSLASAVPVRIESVTINDAVLVVNSANRLDIERGQSLNVEVVLTGLDTARNVEVEAFISGFEFNDVERVSDVTDLFDALPNVTYVKKLVIPLPDSLDKDDYKLRIIVSDRNSGELSLSYNLLIDVPRHLVQVKDVILTPENEITAGGALLASVRVENVGAKAEEDVKVNVAIPQLGVSATKYLNKVGTDDESETEEVYLRLPECAQPGRYDIVAKISYADQHRVASGKSQITVLKNELCDSDSASASGSLPSKIIISVGSNFESVKPGEEIFFPITITNNGKTSKSFTVIPSAGAWASLKIAPTTTAVLAPGKGETFYIFASPNEGAVIGANVVTASVSSGGEVLQQIALTANVVKPQEANSKGISLKRVLELGLVLLLVLLIIVGLIVGFSLLRDENSHPPEKAEPYY